MHGSPKPCGLAESARTHSGVLAPYSKHRQYNQPICYALSRNAETVDLAQAIGNCSTSIGVEIPLEGPEEGKALLRSANPCNRRLCPFCEWRRSRAWRRRFFEGLPKFHEDFPLHRAIFLTLTVRNCAITDLRSTIGDMHRGWTRLQRRSGFPTKFWFRRTEVTHNVAPKSPFDAPTFHPHIHAVLFVPTSYFGRNYIRQTEWQKEWMDAARLDYAPVVDVRRAKTKSSTGGHAIDESRSAGIEAAKYATKATDLISMGDVLTEYHYAIKGLRLSAVSNSLRPYLSDTPPSTDDLMDAEDVGSFASVRGKALWFEDVQEYLFSDIL